MDKYIKKFGEPEILLMITEDMVRMAQALFEYRNSNTNEPRSKTYDRAPCCLDQQLGKVKYNIELLENILSDRHKYFLVDVKDAHNRWVEHTKFHEGEESNA